MSDSEEREPPLPPPSQDGFDFPDDGWEESSESRRMPISAAAEKRGSRHIWLISYSDFMTILMIFFLAMYGYTYLAKEKLMRQQAKFSQSDFSNQLDDMKTKLGSQLKIQEDVDKVVMQLDDQILFASGRAELSSGAGSTLDELAKSVMLIEGDVIVQGHTDNVPIFTGRYKSNWELSAARSFSVISALTGRGVPVRRLAAWGFGENRPVVDNASPANRAQNRRIDVIILKKKQTA
jgi:chemotaxis protein MotB